MLNVRLAVPVALLAVVVGGRALGQEKAVGGKGPETPLIPRAALFGNPDRANPQLSHDGKWLSYLAPLEGVMNVWVAQVGEISKAKAVTHESKRGIRQYRWAYDNAHLLYLQDSGGDENWKIYSVGLDGGAAKDLTPIEEIKGADGKPLMLPSGKKMRPAARIEAVSPKFPTTVVVGLNDRDPKFHDAYKLDLATGKMELLKQNDRYASFEIDDDYRVRLGRVEQKDGSV